MSPIRCDSATLFNNLMSACGWHSKGQRKRIGTHLEQNKKILPENFSRMNWTHSVNRAAAMLL